MRPAAPALPGSRAAVKVLPPASWAAVGSGAYDPRLGRLAQLVERLPYKQEVTRSSRVPPTRQMPANGRFSRGRMVAVIGLRPKMQYRLASWLQQARSPWRSSSTAGRFGSCATTRRLNADAMSRTATVPPRTVGIDLTLLGTDLTHDPLHLEALRIRVRGPGGRPTTPLGSYPLQLEPASQPGPPQLRRNGLPEEATAKRDGDGLFRGYFPPHLSGSTSQRGKS
jgi:hypothetical protein